MTSTVATRGAEAEARHGRSLLLLLGGCSALGPVSNLMLMPALPAIRVEFATSTAATQSVISAFLFAFAVGILFAGPLSDRYGRRPLILAGLAIFIFGCLQSALAPSMAWLVGGRVIQAIGSAVLLTVARAVVGDLFTDWRLAQALANLTLAMMLGTSVSPYLGGAITASLGWHGTFWLMILLAAAIGIAVLRQLPETRKADASASSFAQLGRSSIQVLRNPRFFACAVDVGVIYAVYLVFISIAPYVMSEMLGSPPTDFGKYSLLVSAGYFLGNLYISRRARTGNLARLAQIGCTLQAGSAVLALALVLAGFNHPLFWFLPMLPLAVGQGLALPHITATAVQLAPGFAGVASSLIGFTQQVIAGAAVQAIGFAPTNTPVPVLTLCAALSLVSFAMLLLARRSPAATA